MILWITFKDIAAFFRSEKRVFIWLIVCMVCGAFVLNYSYTFARWYGDMYEYNLGADIARYKANGSGNSGDADALLNKIQSGGFPELTEYQFFTQSHGFTVSGSSVLTRNSAAYTGMWVEGYARPIEHDKSAIAVSDSVLEYGERLKMTGEVYTLDGEDFIIRGVYEKSPWGEADAVIFSDKFLEKYRTYDALWLTFSERLNGEQTVLLEQILGEYADLRITEPTMPGSAGEPYTRACRLQYSAIVVLLVVCLTSLIKYWQRVNLPTYTVYWINGATFGTIITAAMCEAMFLCVPTYLAGLLANFAVRRFSSWKASLTANDLLIGFGIFFGTFALFTLINTVKICREFKVANVRRD